MASDALTPETPATAEQLREDAAYFRDHATSLYRTGSLVLLDAAARAMSAAAALDAEAARREAGPERELRKQRDKAREREIVLELALRVVANDCLDPRWQEHAETALAFTPEAPDAK